MNNTEVSLVLQVAAGAEWLDEHYPGWEDKVDVFRLNMADGNHCVLGQVGRTMAADRLDSEDLVGLTPYAAMLDLHYRAFGWAGNYGFGPLDKTPSRQWADQAQLLWISEINRRRLGDVE